MIPWDIKRLLNSKFFYNKSFSQEGEDIILQRLLPQRKGIYVDVGCHHPYRYSNTYLLYQKGWTGICIDPLPGTINLFKKIRPRDIVIEMGITQKPSILTYYQFNESALNTFNPQVAAKHLESKKYKIINKTKVLTDTLSSILHQYKFNNIDILSIDVEGMDLEVIKSLDFNIFRPKTIVIECLNINFKDINEDIIYKELIKNGYFLYAKTGFSLIMHTIK
jgi:FkbM family methyltransferase